MSSASDRKQTRKKILPKIPGKINIFHRKGIFILSKYKTNISMLPFYIDIL